MKKKSIEFKIKIYEFINMLFPNELYIIHIMSLINIRTSIEKFHAANVV
jgi:hypothetical protein